MRGHAPPPSRPSRCADPELVLGLRRFLINYASDPSSPLFSGEQSRALATLLAAALPGVVEDDAAFDCMWRSTPQWRTLGEDLSEVEAGLQALQQLFSRQELAQLVRRAPALLAAPLRPWLEFFEGVGFTEGQVGGLERSLGSQGGRRCECVGFTEGAAESACCAYAW